MESGGYASCTATVGLSPLADVKELATRERGGTLWTSRAERFCLVAWLFVRDGGLEGSECLRGLWWPALISQSLLGPSTTIKVSLVTWVAVDLVKACPLLPMSVLSKCWVEWTRDSACADDVRVLTKSTIGHNGGGVRLGVKTLAPHGIALGRMVSMSRRNFYPMFLEGLRSSFDYVSCILVVNIVQLWNIRTLRAMWAAHTSSSSGPTVHPVSSQWTPDFPCHT